MSFVCSDHSWSWESSFVEARSLHAQFFFFFLRSPRFIYCQTTARVTNHVLWSCRVIVVPRFANRAWGASATRSRFACSKRFDDALSPMDTSGSCEGRAKLLARGGWVRPTLIKGRIMWWKWRPDARLFLWIAPNRSELRVLVYQQANKDVQLTVLPALGPLQA